MSLRLEINADEEWAGEVAARLTEWLQPGRRICVATGNTVTPVYRIIDDMADAEIFLLDEFGGLPPNDPGRCRSMIQRDLLDHAQGAAAINVPDVDAADPKRAASAYGSLLADGGIDLAVVGLGANGHIGMNEPGSTSEDATRVVTLEDTTSRNATNYGTMTPPTWGITVGISELMEADEVWLLVTGSHKTDILDRVFARPIGPDLPATFLRDHPQLTVFVDRSASGR